MPISMTASGVRRFSDILHAAETDTQFESTGDLTVRRSPRARRAKATGDLTVRRSPRAPRAKPQVASLPLESTGDLTVRRSPRAPRAKATVAGLPLESTGDLTVRRSPRARRAKATVAGLPRTGQTGNVSFSAARSIVYGHVSKKTPGKPRAKWYLCSYSPRLAGGLFDI